MLYELDNIEKRVLLGAVVDRARVELNDGKPLTEMSTAPLNPDPEAKIEQMVHELAYERVKQSYLFNTLENDAVDRKADELAGEIAALIETWIVDAVTAECKEG